MQKRYRFAFAHSDPGSVNAINGLLEVLNDEKIDFDAVVVKSPADFIGNFDFLFTGTSVEHSLEFDLIQLAKDRSIPSLSVIDHWVNYKKRFERNGILHWPTIILVNDEIAKEDAIKEGVPQSSIKVFGNPWWHLLLKKAANVSINQKSSNEILFLSDNLHEVWGTSTKEVLGYDEFKVLQDLIDIARDNFRIKIRLHPKEKPAKYDAYKGQVEFSTNDLLGDANRAFAVVGMFTNALIESALVNKRTMRYEPNRKKNFLPSSLIPEYSIPEQLKNAISGELTNRKDAPLVQFDREAFILELKKHL